MYQSTCWWASENIFILLGYGVDVSVTNIYMMIDTQLLHVLKMEDQLIQIFRFLCALFTCNLC